MTVIISSDDDAVDVIDFVLDDLRGESVEGSRVFAPAASLIGDGDALVACCRTFAIQ